MPAKDQPDLESTEPTSSTGVRFVKTALLMVGSAFLGGLAVVVLNRKALINLRHPDPPNPSVLQDANDD